MVSDSTSPVRSLNYKPIPAFENKGRFLKRSCELALIGSESLSSRSSEAGENELVLKFLSAPPIGFLI